MIELLPHEIACVASMLYNVDSASIQYFFMICEYL